MYVLLDRISNSPMLVEFFIEIWEPFLSCVCHRHDKFNFVEKKIILLKRSQQGLKGIFC